jgi:hypothetical protein
MFEAIFASVVGVQHHPFWVVVVVDPRPCPLNLIVVRPDSVET